MPGDLFPVDHGTYGTAGLQEYRRRRRGKNVNDSYREGGVRAMSIFSSLKKVVNETSREVLDSQVIDKMTGVLNAFLKSGVEAVKELTKENQP
jgi:hypothetical protein